MSIGGSVVELDHGDDHISPEEENNGMMME
jgi:hypothetical protein